MFWAIDFACLVLIVAAALLVVVLGNLNAAVLALSAVGTVLTVVFVVLGAPDDAQAEAVVGAIALPVLYLVAIGKSRVALEAGQEQDTGEEEGTR